MKKFNFDSHDYVSIPQQEFQFLILIDNQVAGNMSPTDSLG